MKRPPRAAILALCSLSALLAPWLAAGPRVAGEDNDVVHERNVAVPMRDGVTLRADVWRPRRDARFPTLVCRTPYGRTAEVGDDTIRKVMGRGYALVVQDVRGRYDSEGEFNPYFQEGQDGFDTIEWAARQAWSSGAVGTFGLSYPGAVQWLAAVEGPPHLRAMVPAMTFSTPRNFVYSGGLFDGSWVAWTLLNIAPDVRARNGLPGPRTREEAARAWREAKDRIQRVLPLSAVSEMHDVAPWYRAWLEHPPEDAWWEALDLRTKYGRTNAAVLNFSGWYDETYGPEGATTNFRGLLAARSASADPETRLVLGPWVHGVPGKQDTSAGERDFGPRSYVDYDEMVLRWMDRHVKGIDNGVDREPRVHAFVMGENQWHDAATWPPPGTTTETLFLASPASAGRPGTLAFTPPHDPDGASSFVSDPFDPVVDPYPANTGAHDYSGLAARPDVLVWETPPLERDLRVVGHITATIHLSCDAPDTDLWVKLLDVGPDGKAVNLMSPGLDVLRASYREPHERKLLEPGNVYRLEVGSLITGNTFLKGHRMRVQVSGSFFPHFSRNLHTGERETTGSGVGRKARITIHHSASRASSIALPVLAAR